MGGGPDIALVLHPRRDPGAVLESDLHQRRNQLKLSLLDLPFLPDCATSRRPAHCPGDAPGEASPSPRTAVRSDRSGALTGPTPRA